MKKSSLVVLIAIALFAGVSYAEDAVAPAATEAAAVVPAAEPAPAPSEPIVAAPDQEAATVTDNLEFISGEVSALDEAAKTVSVRLYGENEDKASDKVLSVNVDENTDITDGEQDRELKSLTAGTEVDVEYDPATNKATYIFVY